MTVAEMLSNAVPLAAIDWNVSAEILRVGPFALRWYSMLFLAGFLLGLYRMHVIYRREGRDPAELDTLLLVVLAGTLIGARLGHCFFYRPAYFLQHPLEIPQIWQGGLASHGGMIGILIAVWLFCRRPNGPDYMWLIDRLVIPATLSGALIRIGNLFNSEILGTPTEMPWGVRFLQVEFPEGFGEIARHPVMLYESAAYFLVFGILWRLYSSWGAATPRGALLGVFLVGVFIARFVLEFFKLRQAEFADGFSLSVGQWLSVPAVALGTLLLMRAAKSATPPPESQS